MKILLLVLALLSAWSCTRESTVEFDARADSIQIAQMISVREKAMIDRDIPAAIGQFSENATWINSQGYLFEGRDVVRQFHQMLAANDSADYYYEAGKPRIRVTDPQNAIAYYSWKMYWFRRESPADTLRKEVGLMTLTAQKQDNMWRWIAVTNQHTPWFYETIEPVFVE